MSGPTITYDPDHPINAILADDLEARWTGVALSHDLVTIALKCLEKEPGRR